MEFVMSRVLLLIGFIKITLVVAWEGKIVFEDNFTGNSLNLKKWEYEEGCGFVFGRTANDNCYSRKNVAVRNGKLHITVTPNNKGGKRYSSGQVRQKGPGFRHGTFVARARLSRGDHLNPSIWLLNRDDKCQEEEIDIAKYRGQSAEARNVEMGALWGRKSDMPTKAKIKATTPFDLSSGYHKFAVEWLPSKIKWYVDKLKYFELPITNATFGRFGAKCQAPPKPFKRPVNLVLNVAVGGFFFYDFPQMNPSTWKKPSMEIDWVRVYQK